MPEWSIGTVSKTVVPLRVPRVRIPVFPQNLDKQVIKLIHPILHLDSGREVGCYI